MNHLRTIRTLAALLVFTMIAGTALAQSTATSDTTATVTSVNTMSMTGGGSIALAPAVGTDASNASTSLTFETNDGTTYRINASASAWVLSLGAVATTSAWPVLTVETSSVTGGTGTLGPLTLIDAVNTATARDIVTSITSASGTATVTLGASVTQTVVAGTYSTTITYDFTNL